jgi:hypothetical protein
MVSIIRALLVLITSRYTWLAVEQEALTKLYLMKAAEELEDENKALEKQIIKLRRDGNPVDADRLLERVSHRSFLLAGVFNTSEGGHIYGHPRPNVSQRGGVNSEGQVDSGSHQRAETVADEDELPAK